MTGLHHIKPEILPNNRLECFAYRDCQSNRQCIRDCFGRVQRVLVLDPRDELYEEEWIQKVVDHEN